MKADRLISILMLLQINNQLTAKELANRLEVSVRTIYRDIDSLSGLGLPIICDRGINGGIRLLGDYKTSLTGINRNELYSLFIPTGDKILNDLGIEKVKESTMLKFFGSSSSNQIDEIKNIQNYIYIDMYTWSDDNITVNTEILATLQSAIWNLNVLNILYQKIDKIKEVSLSPLGLVCKRGNWYLVAINNEIIKTYKVSSVKSATLTKDTFDRPSDFNLENHWKDSTSNFKSKIPKYKFKYKINPSILELIKNRKFISIKNITTNLGDTYVDIEFDAIWQGVEFAFTYGKDIKIIEPSIAIEELKKKATEIIEIY